MASYIGVSPPEQTGIVERYKYTGDGSTTAFSGADTNSKTLRYTSTNPVLVFLNGVQLVEGTDFTKTSNTVITFTTAPANSDDIEILTFGSFDLNSPTTIRCDLGLNTTDSPTFNGLTTTGNINLGDDDVLNIGTGNDLQLYHDASDSYIKDAGTGDLRIEGSFVRLVDTSNSHTTATFASSGVNLRYANSVKLTTTSTGIDVPGTITADKLDIDSSQVEALRIDSSAVSALVVTSTASSGLIAQIGGVHFLSITDDGTDLVLGARGTGGNASGLKITTDPFTTNVTRLEVSKDGDVSFYESTGTTQKLFWDASTERLGIGTTSPSNQLHLYSDNTSPTPSLLIEQDGTGDSALSFKITDSSNALIMGLNNSNGDQFVISYNGTDVGAGTSAITINTASRVGILKSSTGGGNALFQVGDISSFDCKVGIGTTSPEATLHVYGGIALGTDTVANETCGTLTGVSKLTFGDNNANGVQFGRLYTNSNTLNIQGGTSGLNIIGANGTTHMNFNCSTCLATICHNAVVCCDLTIGGNLTVNGTTTTINTATLDVEDLNITIACGAATAAAADGAGITVDGASACLTYGNTNDDWTFNKSLNVTGDCNKLTVCSSDHLLTIICPRGNTGANLDRPVLKMFTDGANEKIRLDSSGCSFIKGGNLGIGTTSPSNFVHIQKNDVSISAGLNARNALLIEGDEGSNGVTLNLVTSTCSNAYSGILLGNSTSTGLFQIQGKVNGTGCNKKLYFYAPDGYYDFTNYGTTTVCFCGSNVGIGTGTPASKLHVEDGEITVSDGTICHQIGSYCQSVYFGENAACSNTTGNANVAVGRNAALTNTIGCGMVAIGFDALRRATTANENVAVGKIALGYTTTGNQNTALGTCALYTNTTGASNVGVGKTALFYNTTGTNNTAVGTASLHNNTTGIKNVGVGRNALYSMTSGYSNIGIGYEAGFANTCCIGNVAIGDSAFRQSTTGNNNVAIGRNSLYNQSGVNATISIGYNTLCSNTTGCYNIAIGQQSLQCNTTGSRNIGIGYASIFNNTIGNENIGVGIDALNQNTTGCYNIGVGYAALYSNTTGCSNTAVGGCALYANVCGRCNTAVGYNALRFSTEAYYNTAVGERASCKTTTGQYNTVVGFRSSVENTTGTENVAIGSCSMHNNVTGSYNVAIGHGAGYNSTNLSSTILIGRMAGINNTATGTIAIGRSALDSNTIGEYNIGIGYYALQSNTTGRGNIAIGYTAMYETTTGQLNTAVGCRALGCNTTGNHNQAFGTNALLYNTTGSGNIGIGTSAALCNTTGIGNVAVGLESLRNNVSGIRNIAIGECTGRNNVGICNVYLGWGAGSGVDGTSNSSCNVFIGTQTAYCHTTGTCNVAIGVRSMFNNTTGDNNVALGAIAMCCNTTGRLNVAVGTRGLHDNTSGQSNISMGFNSLCGNTTGSHNIGFGTCALLCNTGSCNIAIGTQALEGSQADTNIAIGFQSGRCTTIGTNVAVGHQSMCSNTTGQRLTTIGYHSLLCNTTATNNTAVGYTALRSNTIGTSNTAVGDRALCTSTTGSGNTAIGQVALMNNTIGQYNTAIGTAALQFSTTATGNVAVGVSSSNCVTTGQQNTSVGGYSLRCATEGDANTAIGYEALRSLTTGFGNVGLGYQAGYSGNPNYVTAIGREALYNNTCGQNTAVGFRSSYFNVSAINRTSIGAYAAYCATNNSITAIGRLAACTLTTGQNNTVLGYNAQPSSATVSNEVTLGDTNVTSFRIPGLTIHADSTGLGLGTDSPTDELHLKTGDGNNPPTIRLEAGGGQFTCLIGMGNGTDTCLKSGYGLRLQTGANSDMHFYVNATERMAIQCTGHVGIGVSSPSSRLEVRTTLTSDTQSTPETVLKLSTLYNSTSADGAAGSGTRIEFEIPDDETNPITGAAIAGLKESGDDSVANAALAFYVSQNDTTLDEAMRINSTCQVLVGTTSVIHSNAKISANMPNTTGTVVALCRSGTTAGARQISFYNPNGEVGYICTNASSTNYNTSSDYRLKENVTYEFDATLRLKQLKPARFNFTTDTDRTVDGFLAHEVSNVVPEAISGEKDAVDENGNPEYQGIDQSKLVPVLTKALQEAITKIEELETRIQTLEDA